MIRTILITLCVWYAAGIAQAATPNFCLPGDPAGFNPQLASDDATRLATRPIYDRLVEMRASRKGPSSTITLEPGLAESWEVARNGRVYTFQLRRNVAFHHTAYFTPSRSFNADDVLFSFNRQRLSAHPLHHVGGATYPDFLNSGLQKNLAQVEKVNDRSVRFYLNQPDPDFLAKLSQDGASILSSEYGESVLAKGTAWEIDQLPIGTGPYSLQKYEKGKAINYTVNAAYYRGHPSQVAILFPIVNASSLRAEKIRTGQCAATEAFLFP